MLEAVLADVREQRLVVRNLDHTVAAEGFERIVREAALADVGRDANR